MGRRRIPNPSSVAHPSFGWSDGSPQADYPGIQTGQLTTALDGMPCCPRYTLAKEDSRRALGRTFPAELGIPKTIEAGSTELRPAFLVRVMTKSPAPSEFQNTESTPTPQRCRGACADWTVGSAIIPCAEAPRKSQRHRGAAHAPPSGGATRPF